MFKQLVTDCLEEIVKRNEGAQLQLKEFIKKELKDKDNIDISFLADLLSSNTTPLDKSIESLEYHLTKNSLQSSAQLIKVGAFFDIDNKEYVSDIKKLDDIFAARNNIVHRMDIRSIESIRIRKGRSLKMMCDYTNYMIDIANKFITAVEGKLP